MVREPNILDVAGWHAWLADSFRSLRSEKGVGAPLFALEHGLSQEQVEELKRVVRRSVSQATNSHRGQSYLPFVVYAAELGYDYVGQEYWQSFESMTPGWHFEDRIWIKAAFNRFHGEFGGTRPRGVWAEHFNIIAWPIHHAILPRDLQVDLSKALFRLRSLLPILVTDPESLGSAIQEDSSSFSRRFQQFASDGHLVGHIAQALLRKDQKDSVLRKAALERIVGDLEKEYAAKSWLERAIETASTVFVRPGRAPGSSGGESKKGSPRVSTELLLRPSPSRGWEMLVSLPNFGREFLLDQECREFLSKTRCKLFGQDRWLPRQSLLFDLPKLALRRWPRPEERLITFESEPPGVIDKLTMASGFLDFEQEPLIFKISDDGSAKYVRTRSISPRSSYILVQSAPILDTRDEVRIDCEQLYGRYLNPALGSTESYYDLLRLNSLTVGASIDLWPAGTPAASWNGQDRVEWIAGQPMIMGIRGDASINSWRLSLEGSTDTIIAGRPDENLFFRIPDKCTSPCLLEISVRLAGAYDYRKVSQILVTTRQPRATDLDRASEGLLRITFEPEAPSFDDLWARCAQVMVEGPAGRSVDASASLYNSSQSDVLVSQSLGTYTLPVDQVQFAKILKKFKDKPATLAALPFAYQFGLTFDGGEVGQVSLFGERLLQPLRWVFRKLYKDRVDLSLANDTGRDDKISLTRYSINFPDDAKNMQEDLRRVPNITWGRHGELLAAELDDLAATIIVPMASLQMVYPIVQAWKCSPDSMECAIRCARVLRLWRCADTHQDPISEYAKSKVLTQLAIQLFRVLGGNPWGRAELSYNDNIERPDAIEELGNALSPNPTKATFTSDTLLEKAAQICNVKAQAPTSSLTDLVRQYAMSPDPKVRELEEVCLQLATEYMPPLSVPSATFHSLLQQILNQRSNVAREMRFLALAIRAFLECPTETILEWN